MRASDRKYDLFLSCLFRNNNTNIFFFCLRRCLAKLQSLSYRSARFSKCVRIASVVIVHSDGLSMSALAALCLWCTGHDAKRLVADDRSIQTQVRSVHRLALCEHMFSTPFSVFPFPPCFQTHAQRTDRCSSRSCNARRSPPISCRRFRSSFVSRCKHSSNRCCVLFSSHSWCNDHDDR
jgi:hypothetical protein